MRYYLITIKDYIVAQLQANKQEKVLLVIIPSLDEQVAVSLGDNLQQICHQQDTKLEYKIACELCEQWSKETQDILNRRGYCAQESLTNLRNKLVDGQERILRVLVGAAYVTDKASLEDFHHCDEEAIWQNALKRSFDAWLLDYFKTNHLTYDDEELAMCKKILAELKERFDLLTLSNWLETTPIKASNASGAFVELLNNLGDFGLPHLGGFVENNKKGRSFSQCLDNAEGFFSYSKFMEATSRKKALEHIQAFQDSDVELDMDRVLPFSTPEDFYLALTEYIHHHNVYDLDTLRQCDFIYIWENILKFKPQTPPPTPKETLHKLVGSPLEVILRALWSSFGYFKAIPAQITIAGKRFVHDYQSDDGDASKSLDARLSLTRLLGGLDQVLNEHIQLQNAEEEAIALQADMLNGIEYKDAKNSEPFYEFHIFLEGDGKSETYKFAWKLPAIHPYRLANDLLYLAREAFSHSSAIFPLPVFHLKYYEELFEAVDEDESCRLLQHCIQEADKSTMPFMENIFTATWAHLDGQRPLAGKIEKISTTYKNFINAAVDNGLTAALFENGSAVVQACAEASGAYTTDPATSKCHKLAAMLMRSFMFISRKGDNIDTWATSKSEPNAIISILHPSIIEMQQAKMLFLLSAFNYTVNQEIRDNGKFKIRQWQSFEDMSIMQMPLPGLLTNNDGKLSINIRGRGLLHRIGDLENKTTSMSTRLLTRYDAIDDEKLNTAQLFKETRESKLLYRLLQDYKHTHPHCQDGLSLAVFRNEDLQPVLSAVDSFLKKQREEGFISPDSKSKYFVKLILFTESTDDTGICNLLRQWRDCWEMTDEDESKLYYPYCQISVSHRIVSKEQDHKEFKRILEKEIDTDIIVFYNFIEAVSGSNEFREATEFDSTRDTLKFPILEKAFCANLEPDEKLKRAQIISNRQFRINAAYTELLARIKTSATPLNQWHVILGHGDYEPWQDIIEAAHTCAEWVVCIDANIDEPLLHERKTNATDGKKRELIGFGSGVGIHGESNYTVSTQKYAFGDLRLALLHSFQSIFEYGTQEDDERITKVLMEGAAKVSGLSLIRAIGHSEYKRDFIAYNMMRKILPMAKEQHLCNQMFSIDAYRHWFDLADEENNRPDLLWLCADLDEHGKLAIDMRLIECKMPKESEEHISKAESQIQNGLRVLVKAFAPKVEGKEIPDQRYWHLQLHRLIASCAQVDDEQQEQFLTALEDLIAGDFTIKWNAGIFAFWTNVQQADFKEVNVLDIDANETNYKVPVCTMGYDFILNICEGQPTPIISWDDRGMKIESSHATEIRNNSPKRESVVVLTPPSEGENIPGASGNGQSETNDPPSHVVPSVDPAPQTEGKDIPGSSEDGQPAANDPPQIRLLVGTNKLTGAEVYFYPNSTKIVSHPNLGIIGTMGTGKTQFARSIIAQFSREHIHNVKQTPIGMLVFDYKGDYNDEDFLKTVQGECYRTLLPFNPLKLVVTEQIIKDGLNLPAITADRVTDSLTKAYNLGDVQSIKIKDTIVATYNDNGITQDPSTWQNTPPTIEQIVNKYLQENDKKDKVYKIFKTLQDYPMFARETEQCVSLFEWLKGVKVIDLTLYDDSIKKLVVSLLLDLFYAEMKQLKGSELQGDYREIRAMILVDEAHQFLKKKFDSLRKIICEGRMFGVGMILSTQNLSDFKGEEEDFATFIKSWIIHNVNNPTKSDMATIFGSSNSQIDQYISFISKAVTFDSICKLGNETCKMTDLPYYELIKKDKRFANNNN